MDRLESVTTCFVARLEKINTPSDPAFGNDGWNEEKCRNVLVRHCDHIPRNYQYRDGIQKIFLILRDHMGDENLDLAGGVLYELIEVDCHHTDDPGASFQRWRFHHMQRHDDLELPHVPHMMTITSSIRPTAALAMWRDGHPSRYPIRLSDASPAARRKSTDPSAVRSQKPWMIDNTMWVSSQQKGTRPVRIVNPTEFHEMQWNPNFGPGGRLVDEKVIYPFNPEPRMESRDEQARSTAVEPNQYYGWKRKSRSGCKLKHKNVSAKIKKPFPGEKKTHPPRPTEPITEKLEEGAAAQDRVRQSWFSNILGFDAVVSLRDFLDNRVVLLPSRIPNPSFARKYGLVEKDMPLYSHVPMSLLPTAEACIARTATEASREAALYGVVFNPGSEFRGPLTPQLWYDGGLDFSWQPGE